MDERHSRQAGLVDMKIFECPITVVGAGGIGSFTTLALAKIGFTDIRVFDDDRIEIHNLGNQFYRRKDLNKPKVEALRDIVNLHQHRGFDQSQILSIRFIEFTDAASILSNCALASCCSCKIFKKRFGKI